MRLPLRVRLVRVIGAGALVGATLLPAAAPIAAADPLVLRVGTDQTFQGMNPWTSIYVVDYEIFTLNYDLLVGFGQDLEPVPGFAESWSTSEDGLTTTFKIRPGMKWSDGEPATSEDARYTYQLVLDATAQGKTLGSGYLEPYLTTAGLKSVSAPDPETLVVTTDFPTGLLTQAYTPILPKHIWSKYTIDQIGTAEDPGFFKNDPPVVGTGPYQAVEYKPGDLVRFERNPNYWGKQGAADQVIIQHFGTTTTMVEALKNGELDYVRGVSADAFDQLKTSSDITTVEGYSNGYTYLSFNGYSKPIPGGGASTTAVVDPKFRDAVAYALDLPALVDKVLAGHGVTGTTLVPPYHKNWHIDPPADVLRTFSIDTAKQKLEAAGYVLNGDGKRLDKDGKVLNLRLTWPASEQELEIAGELIKTWFGELGIGVEIGVTEDEALLADIAPPEADGKANWDMYMWGWVGDPDPTSLLKLFTTDEIGGSNDVFYSNPEYDELFSQQIREPDPIKRHALMEKMQLIFYRDAPNIPLYYDSELHAYRTDHFGGWQNQPPDTGTPLFGFGSIDYTLLTDAKATAASEAPSGAPSGAASEAPTTAPSGTGGTTSDSMPLIVGVLALIVIVAVGLVLMRRRGRAGEDE